MKNLLLMLFSFFIFVGCAQKPVVVSKPTVEIIEEPKIIEEPEIVEKEEIIVEEEPIVLDEGLNKIAVIYPSKIVGKYAKTTISTISAYLLFSNQQFQVETFDTYDESMQNIIFHLNDLKEKGFTKVIALFTQNGFNNLNSLEEPKDLNIYFPLINKSEIYTENKNFIFGGISYDKQMNLLQTLSSGKNSMFYVQSYLGNKLRDSYLSNFGESITKEIKRKNNKFKYIMNDKRLIGSTVLLNTPIIKSSIIMSQLTAYEIYPEKILSTQLNYSPLLLKLTQVRDRENFFVASSISEVDNFLEDYATLLGADITYNWVDYSSLVGVNYLLKNNESELIKSKIVENQVNYEESLYKSTFYGFQKIPMN